MFPALCRVCIYIYVYMQGPCARMMELFPWEKASGTRLSRLPRALELLFGFGKGSSEFRVLGFEV